MNFMSALPGLEMGKNLNVLIFTVVIWSWNGA